MSEAVTESLVIKVEGEGQSAIKTLNEVVTTLERIKGVSSNNKGLTSLSNHLDKLGTAVNAIKASNLANLSNLLSTISETGKINIPRSLPDRITILGDSIRSLDGADISKLNQLADGLSALSAVQNVKVPNLNVDKATGSATSNSNLNGSSAAVVADKTFQSAKPPASDLNGAKDATAAIDSVNNKAQSVSGVFSSIAAKVSNVTKRFGEWRNGLFENHKWLGTIKETLSVLGSVAKKAVSGFASVLKKGMSSALSAIKKVGSSIKSAFSNSLLGKFASTVKSAFSGLLRIAKFRLFRTIVKNITQAFKTGIDDMYQYSKAFNGTYAKNMDRLATANLTFKNSIGAIMAPIINTITPFLDKFLTRLVDINNNIAMLFAGLSGKSTYTKAIRATTEYAKANDKASKSTEKVKDKTEELKRSFAGLDEITVIGEKASNATADSSSIADSAKSNTPDYTTMFEEAPVQIAGLTPKLLDSLKGIDWSGLGGFFGKKLNGILDGIDWATIQKKAKDFATRLYTFINGFVKAVDWTLVGKTISEGLRTGLIFLDTLINNLDFSAIGEALGKIINSLADPENAKLLARVIVGWITAVPTIIISMLNTIDWAKVSDTIISFIANFDFKKISDTAIKLLNSFATALSQIKFDKIGKAFGEGISKIDWAGIWNGIVDVATGILKGLGNLFGFDFDTSKLNKTLKDLKEPISKLLDSFKGLAEKILPVIVEKLLPTAVNLISGIVDALSPVIDALAPVIETILDAVSQIFNAIAPVLPVIGKLIGNIVSLLAPIINLIVGLITRIVEELAPILGDIFEIIGEIIEAASPFIEIIMETLDPVIDIIGGILESLGGVIKFLKGVFTGDWEEAWEGIKQIFSGIWNAIKGIVDSIWKGIVGIFKGAWESIKQVFLYIGKWFGARWEDIANVFKGVEQWFGNIFKNAWLGIVNIWQNVTKFFRGIWDGIVGVFKGVGDWFRGVFDKAVTGIKNAFDGVKQWFSNLWQGIWNVIKTPINWIIGGINALIGGLNKIKIDVPDWVPVIGGKTFGFNIPEIPKLAEGGFPEDGLFFANHNELVGQFSNGKTAVANNEQIVEGISEGVASANEEQNSLLREQNKLLRMLLNKNSSIDVSTIVSAFNRKNQRDGRVTVPVAT